MQLNPRWCQGRPHGDGDFEQRLWEVSHGSIRQKSIPGRGNSERKVGKVYRFCNDYVSYCMTFILSNIIVDNFLDFFRDEENETWKILYTISKFSCLLYSQNIKDCGKFGIAYQTPLFWEKDWPKGLNGFSRSHLYLVAKPGLESWIAVLLTLEFFLTCIIHSKHSRFILNYSGKSLSILGRRVHVSLCFHKDYSGYCVEKKC